MKYYKQRINECALCSLCMLTGTDYETASDLFIAEYGFPWGFGGGTSLDMRKLRMAFAEKMWGIEDSQGLIWVNILSAAGSEPPPKPPYALTVIFGGGLWSHCVVVQEDGKVYDPGTKLLHKNEAAFVKHSARRAATTCEISGRKKIKVKK